MCRKIRMEKKNERYSLLGHGQSLKWIFEDLIERGMRTCQTLVGHMYHQWVIISSKLNVLIIFSH